MKKVVLTFKVSDDVVANVVDNNLFWDKYEDVVSTMMEDDATEVDYKVLDVSEEKILNAERKLLEKARNFNFEDELYTIVLDKVSQLIALTEKEEGISNSTDDDGVAWYDDVRYDAIDILYERIADWIERQR